MGNPTISTSNVYQVGIWQTHYCTFCPICSISHFGCFSTMLSDCDGKLHGCFSEFVLTHDYGVCALNTIFTLANLPSMSDNRWNSLILCPYSPSCGSSGPDISCILLVQLTVCMCSPKINIAGVCYLVHFCHLVVAFVNASVQWSVNSTSHSSNVK